MRFGDKRGKGLVMSATVKVFLIDDDKFVLRATEKKFRNYDVEVKTFSNPTDGLQAIVDEKPDICFIDYNMPELSGHDLVVRLSEVKAFDNVGLFILSGNNFDANEVVKLRTLGFYNVFTKPLTTKNIESAFDMHLGTIPFKAA